MASLGKDLAQIRKEQELSLDDVNEATKIPKRIIQSIEDDSIFTDLEENATYIRSYVRTYAKALSIDDKQIIFALDKREKSDYTGSLQKIMQHPPEDSDDETKDVSAEKTDQATSAADDMIHDHSPEFQSGEDQEEADDSKKEVAPKSSTLDNAERSEVRSVDWVDMGRRFKPLKSARPRIWIGLAIILLIAIAGGAFFFLYESNGNTNNINNQQATTQQGSPEPVSTDSLELNIVPPTDGDTSELSEDTTTNNLQNQTLDALPDTLTIVLYAAYGKLEPVRVYTDIMDNINPYWVEQGEALRFNFVNEIRIRGQFSRIVLLMNGHVVQNFREQFYNPDTRLVEIDRSYFEDDPKWLQPSPDSLGIDASPPAVIKERPTFN